MTLMHAGVGVDHHRPKLQAPEPPAQKTNAVLRENRRTWRKNLDARRDEQPQGEQQRRHQEDAEEVQRSFRGPNGLGGRLAAQGREVFCARAIPG